MSNKTVETALNEIEQLETAVAQARQTGNTTAILTALTQLGNSYLASGNIPKALTQFEEGLELAQAAEERELEGRMWGYRGICLMQLGNTHFAQIALYKSHHTVLPLVGFG